MARRGERLWAGRLSSRLIVCGRAGPRISVHTRSGSSRMASQYKWCRIRAGQNSYLQVSVLPAAFGGRLVKTTGDGILATFDGPRCKVGSPYTSRLVCDGSNRKLARSSFLDRAVCDLIAASEIELEDRGVHRLKEHRRVASLRGCRRLNRCVSRVGATRSSEISFGRRSSLTTWSFRAWP